MAKLGVIHYNFPKDYSLQQFLKYAADTGYGYVELQLPDVWAADIDNPEKNAERVRDQVRALGLRVSALAAHNDFLQVDEEAIRSQVDRMKRICGLAKILDGEAVIRSEGGAPKEGIPESRWLDSMYGCFSRCAEFVDRTGVGIAIDNHGIVTNDGDLLFTLLQKVNHPLIGTNLDTMNYRWYGHDIPTCNRFYEMMAPHALHTHFKDGFNSRKNYRGAALGEGEINLQLALDALRKANYRGVYCAEYEGSEVDGGVGYRKCFDWLQQNVK
ncbi:MAG: sugar phosphate isomerase/epimerase [Chloroflexi bacterium]|nr:sugar phosphate isomerase/epimerase [Chloroflexota bacterium]